MTGHRTHPPVRAMREHPDIDQLKRQARELLEAYRAQSPDAVNEVTGHHRTAAPETFALHDAQFVLARSYGFESWPKLKAAVQGVTTATFHGAVQNGDLSAVQAWRAMSGWQADAFSRTMRRWTTIRRMRRTRRVGRGFFRD